MRARGLRRLRTSAICAAGAARPHRRSSRSRRETRRDATGRERFCRKRCGPRPRPSCGSGTRPIRLRVARRHRDGKNQRDRGGQCRRGIARDRGGAARSGASGKTAALVTPDRALGRRVKAALARWNIAAEDSGGEALAETPAGIFARLAAETAFGRLAPVTLLALLKHPLLRVGGPHSERGDRCA